MGLEESCRRGRDHDLTTVRERRDARPAMDVDPDVALAGDDRRARVQPNADRDCAIGECSARCERGSGGPLGGRESDEEGVALSVHLYTAVLDESRAQDAPVLGQRIRVRVRAELVQQPSRALYVSKEECDGAGRNVASHAA